MSYNGRKLLNLNKEPVFFFSNAAFQKKKEKKENINSFSWRKKFENSKNEIKDENSIKNSSFHHVKSNSLIETQNFILASQNFMNKDKDNDKDEKKKKNEKKYNNFHVRTLSMKNYFQKTIKRGIVYCVNQNVPDDNIRKHIFNQSHYNFSKDLLWENAKNEWMHNLKLCLRTKSISEDPQNKSNEKNQENKNTIKNAKNLNRKEFVLKSYGVSFHKKKKPNFKKNL